MDILRNDKHFYLDPTGILEQEIVVPFTGNYHASVWIAVAGTGGEFGVKSAETGEILQSVKVENNTTYTQYEATVPLKKGERVLLYVKVHLHGLTEINFPLHLITLILEIF